MSNLTVCRTCLSFSTRMHELRNTQLQEIFEKLTSKKPNKEDRTTICYICYAQLQKCRRFSEMSLKTEVILTELVSKGIEITNEAISRLTKRKSTFLVTPVDYFYNGSRDETIGVVAKENTNFTPNEVNVKVEKVEIEDSFTEVAYEKRLVMKEEPSIIEEQIVIKEEVADELVLEEYIDVEGEITLNENCESESEDLLQYEEYVDIEGGLIINGKDNLLPRNNIRTNITCNEQVLHFNCNVCSKILSTKSKLKNHIRTHTGQNLYTCDICDKTFNIKCSIIKHMTIHSGLKPYTCLLCDKAFRLKRYLREHIKIHTGEKPYSCDKCIKRFTDKSSCNRHMISHGHSGEKKHICNQCHKKFTRKCYLKTHMRVHTGQKPFTCNVCNKSFAQQCAWKGHMRIHTGEKTHYCDICYKGFYRKGHLHQHMIVHTRLRP